MYPSNEVHRRSNITLKLEEEEEKLKEKIKLVFACLQFVYSLPIKRNLLQANESRRCILTAGEKLINRIPNPSDLFHT